MERKLIEYLPKYVQDYAEIKAIMGAEQTSIEGAWTDAENVMNDQFIQDATENGVKRWESILNIIPKGNYTLDERKFTILARLNEQLPYTEESLRNILTSLCGPDGYTLKISTDTYELTVKLAIANENNVKVVSELLGHSDVKFTYNRYIHIINSQKAEAMNILNITPILTENLKFYAQG